MGLLLGLRLTGLVCLDEDDETVIMTAQGSLLEGPHHFLSCHPRYGSRSLSISANEKRVVESEVGIVRDLREHKPGCNEAEAGVVPAPGDVAPEDGHGRRFHQLRDFLVITKSLDSLDVP